MRRSAHAHRLPVTDESPAPFPERARRAGTSDSAGSDKPRVHYLRTRLQGPEHIQSLGVDFGRNTSRPAPVMCDVMPPGQNVADPGAGVPTLVSGLSELDLSLQQVQHQSGGPGLRLQKIQGGGSWSNLGL